MENDFRAVNHKRQKNENIIDENGVFSCNCARHEIPYILIDIIKGEGYIFEINKLYNNSVVVFNIIST